MNMNNHFIFGIMQLNILLRDTLEYTLPNREFNPEHYDKRVEGFKALLMPNSPIMRFLESNKEQEEKIKENFNNFIEAVYGEESRIVRKIDNKIEVDKAGIIDLYEMVLGLNQTVADIVNGYLKNAKDNNLQDEAVEKSNFAEDEYFRSIANYVIVNSIIGLFDEFQNASREAKGQPSPAINFINAEIQRLAGFLNFIKQHSKIVAVGYNETVDKVNILMESISGKRQLPEGTNFPQLFKATQEVLAKQIAYAENAYRSAFAPVLDDYVKTNVELQKNRSKNQEEAGEQPVKEEN